MMKMCNKTDTEKIKGTNVVSPSRRWALWSAKESKELAGGLAKTLVDLTKTLY